MYVFLGMPSPRALKGDFRTKGGLVWHSSSQMMVVALMPSRLTSASQDEQGMMAVSFWRQST